MSILHCPSVNPTIARSACASSGCVDAERFEGRGHCGRPNCHGVAIGEYRRTRSVDSRQALHIEVLNHISGAGSKYKD